MSATANAAARLEDLYARAGITVVPLSEVLGAEIRDVDLAGGVDEATFAAIHRAWIEHGVLRFRGQRLDDADLVAFSRRFGDLDLAPNTGGRTMHAPDLPEVFVISNVKENGEPIGSLGSEEADWHTDMCYVEVPPKASTLFALEVPADGAGRTGFLNMYRAYETLPADLRRRIEGLRIKHDPAHALQGELREGYRPEEYEDPTTLPGPLHPIVRTHPETGRKALYLGRQWNGARRNGYVPGMTLEESNALLDELWAHVRAGPFTWFQTWRPGDYLIWDNRCVMHYREAFDPNARRIMHRTQIKGDERPF